MQTFTCPFCGPRDETEVSAEVWADYLFMNDAPRGTAREVWVHLTCGEFFVMTRDTLTREVAGAEPLPGRPR